MRLQAYINTLSLEGWLFHSIHGILEQADTPCTSNISWKCQAYRGIMSCHLAQADNEFIAVLCLLDGGKQDVGLVNRDKLLLSRKIGTFLLERGGERFSGIDGQVVIKACQHDAIRPVATMRHDGVLDVELSKIREFVWVASRTKQGQSQLALVIAMAVFGAVHECEANLSVVDINPLLSWNLLTVSTFRSTGVFPVLQPIRSRLASQHSIVRTLHDVVCHIIPEGGVGNIDGENGSQHGRILLTCSIFEPAGFHFVVDAWQGAIDVGVDLELRVPPSEVGLDAGSNWAILDTRTTRCGGEVASTGGLIDGPGLHLSILCLCVHTQGVELLARRHEFLPA